MRIDKMNIVIKKAHTVDLLGLTSIGLFSLCYILFSSQFAELNIQLPFLDFPIFIGEILLFICLVLFAVRCAICPLKLYKWHYALIIYFIFIVIKALYGYVICGWGPLALRDAALFYYFAFAVLGYYFYRQDFFAGRNFLFIGPFFILGFIKIIAQSYVIYWTFSSALLALVFIKAYPHKKIRHLLLALFLFLVPYKWLFLTSRMMIVSNTIAVFYLILAFFVILKINKSIKVSMGILSLGFFIWGILTFSDPVRAKTIISFDEIAATFHENDKIVQEEIGSFKMAEVKRFELYQPEGKSSTGGYEQNLKAFKVRQEQTELTRINREKAQAQERQTDPVLPAVATSNEILAEQNRTAVAAQQSVVPQEDIALVVAQERKLVHPYQFSTGLNNAVFRLFIWRDMWDELFREKPLLGFDFGKPLRSISLEVLGWGWSNWGAQGWMPAHNSYFNIIYRAGIIGVLFLSTVFVVLFDMIREFIRSRSVIGILLCGVLINWFVAANFLMILELPYTAIPIWALYGVTFAYCYKKEASEYELAK